MADISPELLKLLDGDREYVDPSKDPRQMRQIAGTMPLLAPQNPANQGPQLQLAGPQPAQPAQSSRYQQMLDAFNQSRNNPEIDADKARMKQLSALQMSDADKSQEMLTKLLSTDDGKLNMAPLLALSDAWAGTDLLKGYHPPMTQDEKLTKAAALQNQIAAQRGNAAKTEVDAIKAAQDSKNFLGMLRMQGTQGRNDDSALAQFGKEMDPMQGRSGEFGQLVTNLDNGKRAMAVISQYPDGVIPNSKFAELSTAMARLMGGGGGAVAQETINRYIQDTALKDAASFKSFWTNKLTPVDQKSFMNDMQATIQREMDLAKTNLYNAQLMKAARRPNLFNTQGFDQVLRMSGVDPNDFYTKIQSGQVQDPFAMPANLTPAKVGATGGSGSGWSDAQEREYQELKAKMGK